MKFVFALSFVLALAVAKPYDEGNFDIPGALKDDAKLKALLDCLVDAGPCTGVPPSFKNDLPEVFQTGCAKCPEPQKELLRNFLGAVQTKLPTEAEAFNKKYDPEGKFGPALLAAIGAH